MGGLGPVNVLLRDFDYLITKPKLEEGDDFEAVVNPTTLWETAALGEPALRNVGEGEIVQLERKGYFRVDTPVRGEEDAGAAAAKPMILVAIPDGRPRTKGVSSAGAVAAKAAGRPGSK